MSGEVPPGSGSHQGRNHFSCSLCVHTIPTSQQHGLGGDYRGIMTETPQDHVLNPLTYLPLLVKSDESFMFHIAMQEPALFFHDAKAI